MKWSKWKPKYQSIVKKLNIDENKDRKSAKILDDLLPDFDISPLNELINRSKCVVFGAGPSLEEDLRKLDEKSGLDNVIISADGATSAVKKYKRPEIIVTDLDGEVEDQLKAWREGSWLVVHAHGDNIDKVRKSISRLNERVVGTTQVDEPDRLYNFGGFTDGDRAAFLANELGALKIYLAGMDLGREIGNYTGQTQRQRKLLKLEICRDLLAWLKEEFGAPLINITSGGEEIPGVPNRTYPDG